MLRISGTAGEMVHGHANLREWTLSQDIDTVGGVKRVDMPWPGPQTDSYGTTYSVADVMDCLDGKLDEPKNSGRRVAVALEVEIALKGLFRQRGTKGRSSSRRPVARPRIRVVEIENPPAYCL